MSKPWARMTEAERDRERARCRYENMTPEQVERRRARKREQERRARERTGGIPLPPIPDGWAARRLTTVVDPDGETRQQSIRSVPDVEHREIVPDGHAVVGVSTLIGPGGVSQQWVKTREEDRSHQRWLDALPALLEPVRGAVEPVPEPATSDADRLTGYVIGDAHIGMLSWAPETGADWDVSRAERMLCRAVDELFAVAPSTDEALIINVGDLQHADSPSNSTPESGNRLDVDGRDTRVRRAVLRVIRHHIDKALEKHRRVTYINQPGNHDPYATAWLGLALDALYEREPRVTIDTSPAQHRIHEFGRVLIGVTHKPKAGEDLGHLMAARWPEQWGRCTHRVWLCGHVHHRSVVERPGFEIETFGILAPGDAWHAGQGYLARRRMSAIVWHREWGEDARYTVHASRLERAA